MSMSGMWLVWYLVILAPTDAAGRQVGPFGSEAQCKVAEAAYNNFWRTWSSPQSICVQGAMTK